MLRHCRKEIEHSAVRPSKPDLIRAVTKPDVFGNKIGRESVV
jgi:hypothetical protein